MTVGASGAFPLAFLAAFDPGDRVAMAAPFYPALREYPDRARDAAELIRLRRRDALAADGGDAGGAGPAPAGLILASPSNPAGTMLHAGNSPPSPPGATRNGVRLISDEIYHGLTYDERDTETARPRLGLRHRGQQLLQILLDDRLADRLAGAAGGPGPAGGMPGAEHVHLRAPRRPGGGRGGLRLPRGAGGQYRRATAAPAPGCCRRCRRPGSTGSRPPMAPSISGPMSAT